MSAATTSTTVAPAMKRTATRPRSRLARVPLLLIALLVIVWFALTVVVAREHGERRRATFNGSATYVR